MERPNTPVQIAPLLLQRGYASHDQPGELFNVRDDLAERKNLYSAQPEKVRELKELLEKYKRDGRSRPPH